MLIVRDVGAHSLIVWSSGEKSAELGGLIQNHLPVLRGEWALELPSTVIGR